MRLTMVLCNLGVGGAETTAFALADVLHRRGVELQVVALQDEGEMAQAYRRAGLPLIAGLQKFRFDVMGLLRMRKLLRQHRTDTMIVVDAFRNAMFFGLFGAKLSGLPIRTILWSNSTPVGQLGDFTGRLRKYIRRGMLGELVLTSKMQKSQFVERGLPEEKIQLIYNGVDIERFTSSDISPASLGGEIDGRAVVVQIANVVPDKDFDTLLNSAVILARRPDPPCVLLVGRGTDSPEMLRKIHELGIDNVVIPLGSRDDVPAILKVSDVLVLSTRSEVFNVSVLEAMAVGLPVITSDIRAFDEMFDNDKQGLKVPPGDPKALAGGIEKLIDDVSLRNQLAEAGRVHVQQFSQARMAEKFLELLGSS